MLTSPVSGLLATFQEHYDDLLQFLTRRMSDRQRAADVAQETYLKLVNIDEQAVPVLHARSFIFRVAGNLAIDALRREKRIAASHDDSDGACEVACPAPAPEAALLARERLRILDQALLQLPDNARRALLLNRVEGLTQKQIANAWAFPRAWWRSTSARRCAIAAVGLSRRVWRRPWWCWSPPWRVGGRRRCCWRITTLLSASGRSLRWLMARG